jgi:Ca2+-binding RTX toxin-like protein
VLTVVGGIQVATDGDTPSLAAGVGSRENDSISGQQVLRGFEGDDALVGKSNSNDTIYGGTGNDTLNGQAGADSLLGGDGDDVIVWDLARITGRTDASNVTNVTDQTTVNASVTNDTIDGGEGIDSLLMGYSSVDFTQSGATNHISNIETIDLRGRSATTVVLDRDAVEALTDNQNILRIDGDIGDRLVLSDWGEWTFDTAAGEALLDGVSAKVYTATGTSSGETLTVYISSRLDFTDQTVNNSHTNLQLVDLASVSSVTQASGSTASTDAADVSRNVEWSIDGTIASLSDGSVLTTNYRVTDVRIGDEAIPVDLTEIALGSNATYGVGNHLILDYSTVSSITDASNEVTITGDYGDSLKLVGYDSRDWSLTTVLIRGETYSKYTFTYSGTQTVFVQDTVAVSGDITQSITFWGTSGNDTRDYSASALHRYLKASDGDDTYTGGSEIDTVDYGSISDAIELTWGGTAGDPFTVVYDEKTDTLSGIERIITGSGSDTITGSDGADYFSSGNGADNIGGGAGNDTLIGGAGEDTLSGGAGNDVFHMDVADATIDGGADEDTIYSGYAILDLTAADAPVITDIEIIDLKVLGAGVGNTLVVDKEAVLAVTDEDNTLVVDGQIGDGIQLKGSGWSKSGTQVTFNTVQYDEYVNGTAKVWVTPALSTDVLVNAPSAAETLTGSGDSMLDSGNSDNRDYVVLGGTIYSTNANSSLAYDSVTGVKWVKTGAGDDDVYGDANANRIELGAGDDEVFGKGGSDTLIGGSGSDSVSYDGEAAVNVNLLKGTGTVGAVTDYLFGFETVIGSANADTIVGDSYGNKLSGGNGNDTIDGGSGDDAIYGESGVDTLYGNAGSDTIQGGSNGDVIYGGSGNDSLAGGNGDDGITSGDDDTVYGESGNDRIYGERGDDSLLGGNNDDYIHGGSEYRDYSNSTTYYHDRASSGNDTIDGGSGNDSLFGGDGNDSVLGGDDDDYIGLSYSDAAVGSGTYYFLEEGNDTLDGGDGNDIVRGGEGNDSIIGGEGDDLLGDDRWESGNDTFVGGLGDDTIFGGETGTDIDVIDYVSSTNAVQVNLSEDDVLLGTATLEAGTANDGFGYVDSVITSA